ncbi:MAG: D-Ala-D-Ala carboxypeptidase family metallohydrolase [Sphingobacteriales bacterium JAD_PAG50586_3]|nr:MAG: D-Ala-D-Ala carboxypeptidase family metallohydrolase [Sphingobacteriales bacterium JAD_PAG50586_3]
MQLSQQITLANFTDVTTDVMQQLGESPTALKLKYKEQFNPPPNIVANMQKLSSKLDMVAMKMKAAGYGFDITSGYRCERLNTAVGGKKNSAHVRGLAADIRFTSQQHTKDLINALIAAGFKRIGLGSSFIHADVDSTLPHPACWLYSTKFKTPEWLAAWEKDIEGQLKN